MDSESNNRSIRRPGIPIPSFETVAATEPSNFDVDSLVEVESAVSTFCSTRKRRTLDFEEFAKLTKAIRIPRQACRKDLSRAESLLFDLLSCTSPILYELIRICSPKNGSESWCLHLVKYDGNRVHKMRSLAAVSQVPVAKCKSILDQIIECRQESRQRVELRQSSVIPQKTHFSIQSLFPDKAKCQEQSTVEERVAARARAKLEFQKTVSDQAAMSSCDPEIRLRLADALWSHSRHIFARQSRLESMSPMRNGQVIATPASPSPTAKPRPCVITMKDVDALFRRCNNNSSRVSVISVMQELQQCAPQWIVFDTKVVTKQTTVWIHPVGYQEIRQMIGGVIKKPNSNTMNASSPLKRKSVTNDHTTISKSSMNRSDHAKSSCDLGSTPLSSTSSPIVDHDGMATDRTIMPPNSNTMSTSSSLKPKSASKDHTATSKSSLNISGQASSSCNHGSTPVSSKRSAIVDDKGQPSDRTTTPTSSNAITKSSSVQCKSMTKDHATITQSDRASSSCSLGSSPLSPQMVGHERHPVDHSTMTTNSNTLSTSSSLKHNSATSTHSTISKPLLNAKSSSAIGNASRPVTTLPNVDHQRQQSTGIAKITPAISFSGTPSKLNAAGVDGKKRSHSTVRNVDVPLKSPMARKKMKVSNALRINHHLILTDADYDGGEVITPSYASPRGLKILLNQLNSGKRI